MARKLIIFQREQYAPLREHFIREEKKIVTISYYLDNNKISRLDENFVMDISSLAGLLSSNSSIQLQFEQLIAYFPENFVFIAEEKYKFDIEFYFRYCFDEIEESDIVVDLEEYEEVETEASEVKEIRHKVKKIIDLSEDELETFFANFDNRLYGHAKFKEEFKAAVNSFRVFNKIGEHKVLSLFLMGDSGVGKTEVARSIHKAMGSNKKLAKINFGNYSSHDSLNSLIGSPLGYIGSDGVSC
jgi:ATP-dependent Clp protease ATP-binding subunit ClpC